MRTEAFKLTRKELPDALKGQEIQIRVPETDADWSAMVENGDLARVKELARRQLVLDNQRAAVEVGLSEDVTKLIEAGDVAGAVKLIQDEADAFVSSGRKAGTGASATTKRRAAVGGKIEDALADPEKRAKAEKLLAQLGITI